MKARRGRLGVALIAAVVFTGACGVRVHDSTDDAMPTSQFAPSQASTAPPGVHAIDGSGSAADISSPTTSARGSSAGGPEPTPSAAPPNGNAAVHNTRSAAEPVSRGAAAAPAGGQAGPSAAPTTNPSDTPTPAGPSAGPPTSTAPARCPGQKAPINIASVSTMSGVGGEAMKDGPLAVQAWTAATNAKGGINCHPVRYVIADDGADPNRHRALVQQMVESNRVVAFVFQAAVFSGYSVVDYINQKQVPVIGNEGGSTWFYDSPYFFPHGVSGREPFVEGYFAAPALSGAADGKKKVALLSCLEAPICRDVKGKGPDAAKKYGLDLVYNAEGSLTQPDFTSHCLRAQSAGAEIFAVAMDGNTLHRVARSCAAVNYHPVYVTLTLALRTDFDTDPDMERFVGAVWSRAWFDTSVPAMQEFHASLKRYGAGLLPSPGSAFGWAAAKVFEQAAQKIGDNPTAAQVLEGLWSIRNNDFGGLTPPLTFTRGQPVKPYLCFWAPMVKDGRWTGGDKRICP